MFNPQPGTCLAGKAINNREGAKSSGLKPGSFLFRSVPSPFHQFLRRSDVFHIHNVVAALHRIGSMAGDAHADDLGDSGPAHVANGSAPEIMKLEIGNARAFAGFVPRPAKIPDRLPIMIEHPWASVRLLLRPFQPVAHVAEAIERMPDRKST